MSFDCTGSHELLLNWAARSACSAHWHRRCTRSRPADGGAEAGGEAIGRGGDAVDDPRRWATQKKSCLRE
eukprot:9486856-Pyramimonas_sp.AAC.1